jgi:hypothetical protein
MVSRLRREISDNYRQRGADGLRTSFIGDRDTRHNVFAKKPWQQPGGHGFEHLVPGDRIIADWTDFVRDGCDQRNANRGRETTFTVRVTDGAQTAQKSLTLNVVLPLTITTASLPTGGVGAATL